METHHEKAHGVWVERLQIRTFRNYQSLRLNLDARPVILSGPNGAGKTNLLEAISLLAPGRGMRGAKLDHMDRICPPLAPENSGDPHGNLASGEGWAVAARIVGPMGSVDLGTGRSPGEGRRVVRIDGQAARGQISLGKYFSAVWLTPQMDGIFLGGSSSRRRFLDRLIYGFDPAHASRINSYDQALRQRSRLLRDGSFDEKWVAALEAQLGEKGIAISAARLDMVNRLNQACKRNQGPFPGVQIVVEGGVENWLTQGSALEAERWFGEALCRSRDCDAVHGGGQYGPHRSDWRAIHLGGHIPAEQCSTGEQKALLIALVLAHARLLTAEKGMAPVLLLDEVGVHLDEEKRAALFETILRLDLQAWITGTDRQIFADMESGGQFFHVENGSVNMG